MSTDNPVIGLLHAVEQSVTPAKAAFEKYNGILQLEHLIRPDIIGYVGQDGIADRASMRRFARCAFDFSESGIDILVVVCSICARFVPQIQGFLDIPVIAADRPMILQAAATGSNIGVVASKTGCASSCAGQIRAEAEALGRHPRLRELTVPDADSALRSGVRTEVDRIILDACRELSKSCDTIVLSQFTLTLPEENTFGLTAQILQPAGMLAEYTTSLYHKGMIYNESEI